MMRYVYLFFTSLLFAVLFVRCANIVPPTGGPRDELAPVLDKKTTIPNESNLTNYSKEYLELHFNERVQITNYQKEIYTTPSLDVSKFKVTAHKQSIKVEFKQPLDSNTTYTFNFGKSIKDVTENNIAEDIQVAFSTGEKIDSLYITGQVLDHLTNQGIAKALVGLYAINDTAKLFSTKPKYYTRTDQSGNFKLNYIKANRYELIAIEDKNENFKYDLNKERIGFLPDIIKLDSALENVTLKMILEPDTIFKFVTISPRDNYFQIKTNKGIYKDNTAYPDSILKVAAEDNFIQLFDIRTKSDSISLTLSLTDSLGTTIDSTVTININKENTQLEKLEKYFHFERTNDTTYYVMEFQEPILEMKDSLAFFKLRDSLYLDSENASYTWSNNKTILHIYHPSFKKDTVELQFKKDMFTSISGVGNTKQKITYLPFVSDNYGVIKGSVTTKKENYILQLVDNHFFVKTEVLKPSIYTFKGIPPGKYTFRILIDDNNDGIIEKGNFKTRTVPESIYFNKEVLDVKANWEFTDINVTF